MPKPMTHRAAQRAAVTVGAATLLIGGGLLVAPGRFGPLVGLSRPLSTRVVGALDLALVPGLLAGTPRWPWLTARAALNVATAAYTLNQARSSSTNSTRARTFALGLLVATVADSTAARASRRRA